MVYWARSRVFVHKGGPTHPIYEGPYQAKFLKFCAEGGVSWVKGIPKAQRNNYVARALADIRQNSELYGSFLAQRVLFIKVSLGLGEFGWVSSGGCM